jgi:hypothetical protein
VPFLLRCVSLLVGTCGPTNDPYYTRLTCPHQPCLKPSLGDPDRASSGKPLRHAIKSEIRGSKPLPAESVPTVRYTTYPPGRWLTTNGLHCFSGAVSVLLSRDWVLRSAGAPPQRLHARALHVLSWRSAVDPLDGSHAQHRGGTPRCVVGQSLSERRIEDCSLGFYRQALRACSPDGQWESETRHEDDSRRTVRFERYLKSGSGRAFAKRHFGRA